MGGAQDRLPRAAKRLALSLAGLSLLVAAALAAWVPPVPQWPEYHAFADQRAWAGIPNFADVFSNLGFSAVGLFGLVCLQAGRCARFEDAREQRAWQIFFFGLLALGPASAFYHLEPNDARLMLDRLAMSVVFMAWLAIHLGERLHPRLGAQSLPILLVLGAASVLYWYAGTQNGGGDLRAWGYVQFWPIVLVLFLLWRAPPRYTRSGDVLAVYFAYALARVAEMLDHPILAWSGGAFSGHTLKHLLATLGAALALRMLLKRRSLGCGAPA